MSPIKRQFFLAFMVMGSVLPYLPVFLAQRGLSMSQIGAVMSVTGLGIMVSPVAMTLLADWRVPSRAILAAVLGVSAGALAALAGAHEFVAVMLAHGVFAVAFAPVTAVQDGLFFARAQEIRRVADGPRPPGYHTVRVYGTVGFIVPSLVLYALLWLGVDTTAAVWCAAACALLGVANAFTLPHIATNGTPATPVNNGPFRGRRLPTAAAARAMLEPHVLVFCVALLLLHLAITAYYSFYPVYLTETVGIAERWIGLISSLGVTIEIGFILGTGWLLRRWGLRRLMVIGAVCMAIRFALLAWLPVGTVAVGTQLFHGIMVLVVHVAPPIYLNHRAEDAFRSSIQGLFAMTVMGVGRILGNLLGGAVAEVSLTAVFWVCTALAAAAAALFAFAFADGIDDA
ncbi:MAG: MFS transporter [Planctomycetota bacterium]